MRVVILHAGQGSPTLTQTELSSREDLEAVVGGPVELVRTPFEGVTGAVHEYGKLVELPVNEAATRLLADVLGWDDFVVGPLVLFGFDGERDEYADCPLDLAVIAEFFA